MNTYKIQIPFWILIVAVCVAVPFLLDPNASYLVYFLFMTFIYIALAQGWNLVAGYAGQVSLGMHAFFGLGAYVMAMLWSRHLVGYLDPVGLIAAGFGPGILAILVGIPLLSKLKGDYFALGTLGLGEILRLATIQGKDFTGGPGGIMLPSTSFSSIVPHYYIALFLAVFAVALTYGIVKSRIGLVLMAIRDAEPAASACGVNVLTFKVLALALGAFIGGLCGALQANYLFHVEPEGFYNLNWMLYPVLMCVLGGPGTIVGPVIGAVFLSAGLETAKYFLPEIHPVFSGMLIILVIMFLPGGLVGGFKVARLFGRRKGSARSVHVRL